jgi:flagellar hook-basal body complex protein FliE
MVIDKIGVGGASSAVPASPVKNAAQSGADFGKFFEEMVGKVSDLQQVADKSIQGLATGQSKGLHEVMLAVEKANISFQMLTQVRNKAVEAYQEVMRMQV